MDLLSDDSAILTYVAIRGSSSTVLKKKDQRFKMEYTFCL